MSETVDVSTPVLDRFYRWEASMPDSVYLTQPGAGGVTEYSWSEVGEQARRMATHLRSRGFPAGSHIALLSQNCAHWIMADLAIWMAGYVTVPIYPTVSVETLRYVLEHSDAALLMIGPLDQWTAEHAAGAVESLPCISLPRAPRIACPAWAQCIAGAEPLAEPAPRAPDELATIVYTSGSSGQPKGVMISFGAMERVARGIGELIAIGESDRMLSYLPLAHVFERAVVEVCSIYSGCRVFFSESQATFIDDLRRAKPTLFFSVPRLWTKFFHGVVDKFPLAASPLVFRIPLLSRVLKRRALGQLGLEHVRYACSGAAPLPPSLLSWYRSLGLELLEGYGMTENFGYSHSSRPGRARVGFVGQPSPGVSSRLASVDGEVLTKSPGMMMGYYKDPEGSARALTEDGYLKTGDLGEVDADQRLKIIGRVKEQFKTSKGKYVSPVHIENRLAGSFGAEAVCVCGAGQPQPHALLILPANEKQRLQSSAERQSVVNTLAARMRDVNAGLEPHERLQFVVVVGETWGIDNGFLTPTMKIRRNFIEGHYSPMLDAWYASSKQVIVEV